MDKEIYWYVYGPTVYDYSHLGHARTYLSIDIMRRLLVNYLGKKVTLIMNITNIDDKIINKSKETKIPWLDLANKFENEFFKRYGRLKY